MAKLFGLQRGATNKKQEKSEKTEFKSYQSFRLQKKINNDAPPLPSSFRLFGQAVGLIKRHIKIFAGVAAIYSLMYLVLVQGITALHGLPETKTLLEQTSTGALAFLGTGVTLFGELLGAPTSLNATANLYQVLVTLIATFALIWTLRQLYAQKPTRVRDGYYRGMYPFIPFLLVLLLVVVELMPMAMGAAVFTTVVNNGIAATGVEVALWGTGFFVLTLISLYLITSSLFALYIVCLPNMEPMQALRSARQLVQGRRWLIMRKVLFLPFAFLVLAAVLMIPILLLATPIVGWAFFIFMAAALAVAHSYMYGLYRSLI